MRVPGGSGSETRAYWQVCQRANQAAGHARGPVHARVTINALRPVLPQLL